MPVKKKFKNVNLEIACNSVFSAFCIFFISLKAN